MNSNHEFEEVDGRIVAFLDALRVDFSVQTSNSIVIIRYFYDLNEPFWYFARYYMYEYSKFNRRRRNRSLTRVYGLGLLFYSKQQIQFAAFL